METALRLDRRNPPPTVEKQLPFGLVLSSKGGFVNAYLKASGLPTSDLILPEKPNLVQKVIAYCALRAELTHYAMRGSIESAHNRSPGKVFKW